MLYVPRYVASFDLTDSQTLVTGISGAFGAERLRDDTHTQIDGGDLYWKWKPTWQSGGFPFVSFQTEALGRRYEAGAGTPRATTARRCVLPATMYDWGFYAQALYGFRQRWVAGLRADWVGGDCGAAETSKRAALPAVAQPDLLPDASSRRSASSTTGTTSATSATTARCGCSSSSCSAITPPTSSRGGDDHADSKTFATLAFALGVLADAGDARPPTSSGSSPRRPTSPRSPAPSAATRPR